MAENDESENDESNTINISELSEDQLNALAENPEVRKMLQYEETSIPQVASMLSNLTGAEEDSTEAEAYNLLVSGIAERSGRVTESTVRKVLSNFSEEYESVQ